MKKKTIEYPVSVKYRENWGEWEAIREIVQNAMDTGTKVVKKYNRDKGTLVVKDSGSGFDLKNLLIGEGDKDGVSSIGKFHEGMKFALLVCVRDGIKVRIQTNDIVIVPKLTKMFEKNVLAIDYWTTDKSIKGTKVTMKGIKNDYSDRFLTTNLKKGMKDEVLLDKPGQLYVKGIFVKKIKALSGYNLVMERENPMSGDVDTEKVQSKMADLIKRTNNKDYMKLLLKGVMLANRTGVTDHFELQCGSWIVWSMSNPKRWTNAVKDVFGTVKVCYSTSLDHAREAAYKRWTVITANIPFVKGILRADTEAVSLKPKKKDKRVGLNRFSTEERQNLKWARKIVEGAMETEVRDLRVVKFREPGVLGKAKKGIRIKVSEKILDDKEKLLDVVMHEMVHYIWGYGDITEEFQNGLGKVATKVAMYLIKNKGKVKRSKKVSKMSDDSKQEVLEHVRSLYKTGGESEVQVYFLMNGRDVIKVTSALGINTVGMKKKDRILKIIELLSKEK